MERRQPQLTKISLRSEKELQTSLLFYALLIGMYALLFGIAYGELHERSRLLDIKNRDTNDGVHYFTSDEEGLAKAKEYIETLKKHSQSQRSAKKAQEVSERARPDKATPDHTHER